MCWQRHAVLSLAALQAGQGDGSSFAWPLCDRHGRVLLSAGLRVCASCGGTCRHQAKTAIHCSCWCCRCDGCCGQGLPQEHVLWHRNRRNGNQPARGKLAQFVTRAGCTQVAAEAASASHTAHGCAQLCVQLLHPTGPNAFTPPACAPVQDGNRPHAPGWHILTAVKQLMPRGRYTLNVAVVFAAGVHLQLQVWRGWCAVWAEGNQQQPGRRHLQQQGQGGQFLAGCAGPTYQPCCIVECYCTSATHSAFVVVHAGMSGRTLAARSTCWHMNECAALVCCVQERPGVDDVRYQVGACLIRVLSLATAAHSALLIPPLQQLPSGLKHALALVTGAQLQCVLFVAVHVC